MSSSTTDIAKTPPPLSDSEAYRLVDEMSAAPLWRHYGNLFPAHPENRAKPQLWQYAELRRLALHFCATLSLEEAERRVLMLVNPGLTDPPATVNTLFAGIQIITPGETAQAHRHTSNAFRFIIEGSGAYTTVNGERVHMDPGDLLREVPAIVGRAAVHGLVAAAVHVVHHPHSSTTSWLDHLAPPRCILYVPYMVT